MSWAWLLASGLGWYFLSGVLNLIAAHKSQIDAWVESNPRLGGLFKILRGMGLDPWLIHQGLTLLVKGKLPQKLRPPSENETNQKLH